MGRTLKPSTPFAQRLIQARGKASRADIARALCCPLETLGNYERGRTFPDQEMLGRLKEVLGVSLDWLITGKGAMRGDGPESNDRDGLDEGFFTQIVDGIVDALRGLGQPAEARAVAMQAATWYNDLKATCGTDDERMLGLRVMLRRLSRQGGD
ncbi:MAG: helix-turn-helix domain-containing protein [Magnetospirillum sp.]